MSRWFRHYAGLARDDKLVRAAMRCKQPIERVVWVWCAILESAAELDDGGRYELDHAECAYFLRADESDIAAVEDALRSCGRLAEGVVEKWGARQFQSDRSAERTKRYRERQRQSRDGAEERSSDCVTSRDGGCDVTVTHHRTETETDITFTSVNEPAAVEPPTARQRLWSEGIATLQTMGVEAKQSRAIVGKWLKDTNDDIDRILGAIQRAREDQVVNPIPWITAGLTQPKAKRDARTDRNTQWLATLSGDAEQPDFIDGDFEVVGTDDRLRLAPRRD